MSGVLAYTVIVRHPDTDAATALLAGQPVPEWAGDLVHADDLTGGDEGYSALKVGDLKAEIERRNEGREDDAKVPADGNKAALIAALESDDQAQG